MKLKDEVLQKALDADTSVIPRYDIVRPDGTKVAENAQLVLKNSILTAGTPLNKQSLLKDTTASAYGLSGDSALPDDVLLAIRNTASYCPRLRITSVPGATIYVQRVPESTSPTAYTVPGTGVLSIDILFYGIYKVWGIISGTPTTPQYLDIVTTERYSVSVFSYVTWAKFTVTEEVGATIQATHTDGSVASGVVGADKTCTIALYKQGTWTCVCTYDDVASQAITISTTSSTNGTTIEKSPAWTKVVVQTTSGASVRVYKSGGASKTAMSIGGSCTFWLPDTDTWSISASYNGKFGSGFITPTLYGTKTVSISLN